MAARSDAVEEAAGHLYGVPLTRFVAERKERAAAIKASGDKASATAVAALARPSLGAWVVNQLARHDARDLDALLEVGQEMRRGEDVRDRHRDLLAKLRGRAAEILASDGHAPSETTLRRVTTTLLALSAYGSFDPDPHGQLVADRDPPGFEVMAGVPIPPPRERRHEPKDDDDSSRGASRTREAETRVADAESRAAAEKERQREQALERASAELRTIEGELAAQQRAVEAREREIREQRERLRRIEDQRDAAAARVAELEDARARAASALAELAGDRESSD
jgi:hypothetical protein